ncbi:hypothetical protein WG66_009600 [Moniliophthora roreri]|nr:hypothetical protein WG66_009600 [Moniliophthora roreri]
MQNERSQHPAIEYIVGRDMSVSQSLPEKRKVVRAHRQRRWFCVVKPISPAPQAYIFDNTLKQILLVGQDDAKKGSEDDLEQSITSLHPISTL